MASNRSDETLISQTNMDTCSETTVEIKIKTLDSQTYTLRVDKCVPVPALKEQIAIVTGVLSEQQRLICRGKVLKDDQLLSAYHVEDGHTLHLVVRQPILASSESLANQLGHDSDGSTSRQGAGPSVVVGTFNLSEQGDDVIPDLGRILSAVLGSIGITNMGSVNASTDVRDPSMERLSRPAIFVDSRNTGGRQQDLATGVDQVNSRNNAFSFPETVPLDVLQSPVIPDSLTTLSQYMSRIRRELEANVRGEIINSQVSGITHGIDVQEAGQGGVPTPAALAEVILSARQMLTEQAAACLSHLAVQLQNQVNVSDPLARINIQTNSIRSGDLLRNLGAFLLELGRTIMTLRMGQAPADAVVNAGPAVYISPSGPNPIMVQPLPFHSGTNFGGLPAGNAQPGNGTSGGSLDSGLIPRNIDIRIRTGPVLTSLINNSRESSGQQQGADQVNPSASGGVAQQEVGVASENPLPDGEPTVRIVPLRTVMTAVPASMRRSSSADSSRGSVGLFYPVLARVQHVASLSFRGSQTSNEQTENGLQQNPDSGSSQQTGLPGVLHDEVPQNGQGSSTQRLDQLFRTMFPVEQIHVENTGAQEMDQETEQTETMTNAGDNQETEQTIISEEGIFLSNLLHQIMPIISQNMGSSTADEMQNGDRQEPLTQGNLNRDASPHRPGEPLAEPSSKRQKRE
ncbi:ubiquitin-like domain-containing protein CIP73 isoform X2 [Impatiens glandulifera]|uniref:ubiquitin-like domain-containing protein CIP73 isoform X2 n=1 Tax=Impatiens glandulifera TaxID=253017 RepID=UPI001FB07FA4|nr:ubiquitin-like domain-containing protein CIP73 isoform X2 [Impatiens glandulifera]